MSSFSTNKLCDYFTEESKHYVLSEWQKYPNYRQAELLKNTRNFTLFLVRVMVWCMKFLLLPPINAVNSCLSAKVYVCIKYYISCHFPSDFQIISISVSENNCYELVFIKQGSNLFLSLIKTKSLLNLNLNFGCL